MFQNTIFKVTAVLLLQQKQDVMYIQFVKWRNDIMKNQTQEEITASIRERFIIVYSCRKMLYLKDNGFRYLFKCFNEGSRCNFWVFDATPEIREALAVYKRPDEE